MIVIAFWSWSFGWNECVLGSRWYLPLQNLTPRGIRNSPADKKHQVTGSVSQTPLSGTSVSLFPWPSFYSSAEVVTGPSLETLIIPGPVVCGNWPQKGIPVYQLKSTFFKSPRRNHLCPCWWDGADTGSGDNYLWLHSASLPDPFSLRWLKALGRVPRRRHPFPTFLWALIVRLSGTLTCPWTSFLLNLNQQWAVVLLTRSQFVQRRQQDCFYLYANTLSILQSPRKFPFNQMTYTSISSCIKLMVRG